MIRRIFVSLASVALTGAAFEVPSVTHPAAAVPQFTAVCGVPKPGFARCLATIEATTKAAKTRTSSGPISGSKGPAQYHTAYKLPCTPGGIVQSTCGTPTSFGGQTIAIVEAYAHPTVESDLAVYDQSYGLPACTVANGCLSVVNQSGGSTLPTTTSSNWGWETALDSQTVHEICQTCKILLVEANSSADSDLASATNTAAALGATEISLSFGNSEWSTESSLDPYYAHPGVAIVAAAGDTANQVLYPAASPNVLAVGGTTLTLGNKNSYGSETVWGSTGSGCSLYETAPSVQSQVANWSSTGCGTRRGTGDVAADAGANGGASVYSSESGSGLWNVMGGTSLAAPIIAGTFALAGGIPAGSNANSVVYSKINSTNSHDITIGTAGTCTTTMCNAAPGYDGPTGLGSPNGVAGF